MDGTKEQSKNRYPKNHNYIVTIAKISVQPRELRQCACMCVLCACVCLWVCEWLADLNFCSMILRTAQ